MSDIKTLIEKLNPVCKRALEKGAELCVAQTNFNVEIEHLLLKLVEAPDTDIAIILRYYEVPAADIIRQLTAAIDKLKRGNSRTPTLSPQVPQMLQDAWVISSLELKLPHIRSGTVLRALLDNDALRGLVYESAPSLMKLPRTRLQEDLPALLKESPEGRAGAAPSATAPVGDPARSSPGDSKTPALDAYTIDLTADARAGKIDPIKGRDGEIRQIVDILMRRRQNNPILVGEAGVGKTAIVEGFANQIAANRVPPPLQGVSVRILDLGLLQAGAGMRGEFENRLKSVIAEVKASARPIILFIDEAHTLIGAGGQAGQNDAANLLKPALARGELRTIAATTWAEYKKYFEKDPALARRFQVVKVDEPDEDTAVEMLRGLVPKLERHHGVRIMDEAIREAVALSHRYITGRQLPDKAIGVLDTASARVAIAQHSMPAALEDAIRRAESVQEEINTLKREQQLGIDHGLRIEELTDEWWKLDDLRRQLEARWQVEVSTLQKIRDVERRLEALGKGPADEVERERLRVELDSLRLALDELQGDQPMVPLSVDKRVVADVVSGWTGIPVGKIMSDEIAMILRLKDELERRVVGQPAALETIARRVRTFRAHLDDPGKPAGVFLLVGPSGVGKTETAISLADLLYGGERNMVTINMSEYQEAHSVSGLKGAPPGYVGYGQGGVLTEAVRRNPYSVVLLDEVEKAHPDVLELFYQVFDKGVLEDGEGQEVDFKNTMILLTSNVGSDTIMRLCERRRDVPADELVQAIWPELLRHFRAAFLGRLVVVPYLPLGDDQIRSIVRLKLEKIQKRFWEQHRAELSYDDEIVDLVADRCTEADTGARNIDHILTNSLLPELSAEVLDRMARAERFDKVHIGLDINGNFTYAFGLDSARERDAAE